MPSVLKPKKDDAEVERTEIPGEQKRTSAGSLLAGV